MHEGGEQKLQTNINAMLEQLGISVNADSVIRKTFYKYLHPKEAYISNGILNQELVRY
jgi:intraflagellar transport protein 52